MLRQVRLNPESANRKSRIAAKRHKMRKRIPGGSSRQNQQFALVRFFLRLLRFFAAIPTSCCYHFVQFHS